MEVIQFFIDLLQDPRGFIAEWIAAFGMGAYIPIFFIIFIETGVVIMPFLPGDSLLFTAGIFAADGGGLSLFMLLPVVWVAALADSSVNLSARAWVKNADYWNVFFENNEKFYKQLPEKGINFPFPQMDVHVKNN